MLALIFGWFLAFAKPNRPKTGLNCSTWTSNCTSRTAYIYRSNQSALAISSYVKIVGFSPHTTSQHSHPKTRGNICYVSNARHFDVFSFHFDILN
ncbi:hypothetical protein COI61_23130 [Bacillus cereus]|nr:hypothetical protein COI61_23130 [Bacillus cereus]